MSGAAVLPPVAPGWDCHVHVFDEAAPAAPGHYQAAHRPLEDIEALAATQGLGHLVLVQPSVYGNDHRVMLQALRQRPGRHAGVAVVDAGVSDATLDDLHAAGVRGARFNLVSPVGNRDSEAPALLAPRLAARGWHIQWYARAADLPRIAALHAMDGAPVAVLDHLAGLHPGVPPGPAWQALARLAAQGAWIKLSGWYRLGEPPSANSADWTGLDATLARLAALFGQRCVFGSDWPHTAYAPDTLPDYASMAAPIVRALGAQAWADIRLGGARLYAP